jgi:cyclophilin family peptidyl-prolyl cis-trans isomerase
MHFSQAALRNDPGHRTARAQKVKLATRRRRHRGRTRPRQGAQDAWPTSCSTCKAGHYDGTIFHRVIDNFMIQGGGMTADLAKSPPARRSRWKPSNGLNNVRGTLAMARTNVPDSATAQFFINVVDNAADAAPPDGNGYAVFGKVVEGMDVVDKIKSVPRGQQGPAPERAGDPGDHQASHPPGEMT